MNEYSIECYVNTIIKAKTEDEAIEIFEAMQINQTDNFEIDNIEGVD